MAKKQKKFQHADKQFGVIHIDSINATRMKMPKYNGFVCRGGVHGDTKYNRRKFRRETYRLLHEE